MSVAKKIQVGKGFIKKYIKSNSFISGLIFALQVFEDYDDFFRLDKCIS